MTITIDETWLKIALTVQCEGIDCLWFKKSCFLNSIFSFTYDEQRKMKVGGKKLGVVSIIKKFNLKCDSTDRSILNGKGKRISRSSAFYKSLGIDINKNPIAIQIAKKYPSSQ